MDSMLTRTPARLSGTAAIWNGCGTTAEANVPLAETFNTNIPAIVAQGGIAQVNHPNYRWSKLMERGTPACRYDCGNSTSRLRSLAITPSQRVFKTNAVCIALVHWYPSSGSPKPLKPGRRGSARPAAQDNAGLARDPIDRAVISAIRNEGLQANEVMDELSWLADVYGPRGAGTPALLQASDWAMGQFRSWGLTDVHREYFSQGEGWSLVKANIEGTLQRTDGGTIFVANAMPGMNNETRLLPWLTIAVEHYNRMIRILDKGLTVKVALDVRVNWWPEHPPGNGFNTLAEIRGTDLKDEVVILGAHLDGKTNATAATDDGAGCAAMMEAVRILQRVGIRPRRTIRIGLWGGEELGLLGSSEYVRRHYGDRASGAVATEAAKVSVYFNLDNGSGRARGVWLQNNLAAESTLESWIEPLAL